MTTAINKYVLGIVLDHDMEHVLLVERVKNPYRGKLNGVGGKIEDGESPLEAMIREFREETGIYFNEVENMFNMMTITFFSGVQLDIFYIIMKETFQKSHYIITDEETLCWYNIDRANLLDITNDLLAGDGNLSYFINYARLTHQASRSF